MMLTPRCGFVDDIDPPRVILYIIFTPAKGVFVYDIDPPGVDS